MPNGCCCPSCIGCCWPEVAGVLQTIPWAISAPSCPEIDGITGDFAPVDPSNQPTGTCGRCGCYISSTTPLEITGTLWTVGGPVCFPNTCGVLLCLGISCDEDEDQGEFGDECCSRLRLIVSASTPIRRADDLSVGVFTACRGDLTDCNADPDQWVQIAPSSCTCNEDGTLSVIWDLSVLGFYCSGTVASGPCAGKPDCCNLFCDLTGATLVI
jgi:hypothetical protein